jgi:hypothetical protein
VAHVFSFCALYIHYPGGEEGKFQREKYEKPFSLKLLYPYVIAISVKHLLFMVV